jgi:PAS domain S-box-containing protein
MKAVFLGLILSYSLLSISGITWYILAATFNSQWLISVAKVIMLLSYLPISYALLRVFIEERKKLTRNVKTFITFIGLAAAITIVYFSAVNAVSGNWFDISVYISSTVLDIFLLSLAVSLVLIYAPTQMRYIFSIIFVYVFLSFLGDISSLVEYLGIYSVPIEPEFFYDTMLLFAVVAFLIYSFFREVSTTTVEEVSKRLSDTRHAMDDLIRQMPDAACVFSPSGEVVTTNEPFLKTFGVGSDDVMGKFNLFDHFFSQQCEVSQKLPRLKKGETIVMDRAEILFKGGRLAYLSFKIFPTFSQDGAISSYISICEDVTARVKADEELKRAKELVELYIDLMGHDINNMNQVGVGYLEIAMNTLELEEDKKKLLAKPLEAMINSSRLIDNVKKLRRANDGDMHLRPIDLNKLLKDVIAEYGQAPGKEVSIRYDSGDAMVNANELLKDVFANLVSNAIKHTPGAVHINIKQDTIETDGKKYYRVLVEDDGPGIPEELKPIIFDRILRHRTRGGGTGIGLYLAKTLIDNFGGSIAVEDRMPGELKKGTRFIITLPAA